MPKLHIGLGKTTKQNATTLLQNASKTKDWIHFVEQWRMKNTNFYFSAYQMQSFKIDYCMCYDYRKTAFYLPWDSMSTSQMAVMLYGWEGNRRPGVKYLLQPTAGWMTEVTCGLTAYTPGSAPGPTLGNEYGKPFTVFIAKQVPQYTRYRGTFLSYLPLNEILIIAYHWCISNENYFAITAPLLLRWPLVDCWLTISVILITEYGI